MTKYWLIILMCSAAFIGCDAQEPAVEEAVAEAVEVVEGEETEAAQTEAKLPVALVAFGDVDEALMTRVQKWASHNLAIPVPVLPAESRLQLNTFNEVVEAAKIMLPDNQLGLVVIWRPATDDVQNHGAIFPEQRIAVANLNPLFTPDTEAEVIERRVDRQAIRGICTVMGMEPSPNPLSAMFNYTTLEQLDRIGRNLDLPWLVRLQKKAVEAGIEITEDSPYNVLR